MNAVRISGENLMLSALREGCDGYIPVFDGEDLVAEGGVPEVSLANLRKLLKSGRRLASLIVGQGGVLFVFTSGESYLATSFSVGSDGIATSAIAEIASEGGLGTRKSWFQYLRGLPTVYDGELITPPMYPSKSEKLKILR